MGKSETVRIVAERAADARVEREHVMVTLRDGQILAIDEWNDATRPANGDIDARDCTLLPGFIDIHIHGGAGNYVMDGTMEALDAIAMHLARHGVTGFLSTTITAPWEQQEQALDAAARRMRAPLSDSTVAARVLGCHLEGPYINPKKKGAQPLQHIRLPDVEEFYRAVGDNLSAVRVMTIAPEMPGALDLIRALAGEGILASLGHTDATYAEVSAAIDAGARHVTHCYNAMRQLESREPGVVGAAFARPELTAELIWDNHHVHPASCRALVNAKGAEGVVLISDGIPGTGMPDGTQFSLGDLPVIVRSGTARLPDGTLAGSLLTLDRAFQNAQPYSLSQRARMTSYNAALALGLSHRKGLIAAGYDADLVLIDPHGAVRATVVAGQIADYLHASS